nr:unnamed protein product [Callosobruchus chinensis]
MTSVFLHLTVLRKKISNADLQSRSLSRFHLCRCLYNKNDHFLFYAFPPFCLVAKVLDKISNDKATGIVIVPNWPTQPWYPLFKKLLISNPIVLEPMKNLLLHYIIALHWLPGYYPESNDKNGSS